MKEPFSIATERQGDWAESLQSFYFRAKSHLKRYWWVLLITTSLSVAYQVYKESHREPLYISYAQMKLDSRVNIPDANAFQESHTNFIGTERELMESTPIKEAARALATALHPELKEVPVDVVVEIKRNTSLFKLTAYGSDPAYVQAFLDALMKAYQNYKNEERNRKAKASMLTINEQIGSLEKDINAIEDQLVEFQKRNNLVVIQERGASVGSNVSRLKSELAELRLQQKHLNNLSLEDHLRNNPVAETEGTEALLNLEAIEVSDSYQEAKKALDEAQAKRSEFALYLKDKHPKMMRLKREIERQQNRVGILKQQALAQLEKQRHSIATRMTNLGEAIREAETEALDYSQRLAEYDRLEAQRNRKRQRYEKLLDSLGNIDISAQVQGDTVSIYQHATEAHTPGVNKLASLAEGLIVGMLSGWGIIFLIGSLDKRVISTEDLKRHFEEPVLGIIPKETSFDSKNLAFLQNQNRRHIFAEAFRTLRSSILFMEQVEPSPNTFIVTSAVPEEGKSTIASNLAISLALASSRVLLVDADLRRGRLNRLFQLPNRNGLIEVLQGHLRLDEAIYKSEVDNLDFIPRGKTVSNSGELLLSERMQNVLDTVKRTYDFVIFDAAPVLATDDTTSFASKVDSILYVVRSTTIRLRQVKVSLDSLKMRGATISGFIMNFADTRGMDYYYYNKYQYYYRYQSQEVNS